MSDRDVVLPATGWSEPTDLLALVPGPRPVWAALHERLVTRYGAPIKVSGPDDGDGDPCLAWSAGLEVSGRPPFVLWAEQVRAGAAGALPVRGAACRWLVGVQTGLDPRDPLATFWWLMQTVVMLVPDTPAVLDVNTKTWIERPELERNYLNPDVEPPLDQLWIVERVDDGDHTTLSTRGLVRCALPELEMHGVPPTLASSAVAVMNAAAGLLLETPATAIPGGLVEVGPGLTMKLQTAPSRPGPSLVLCAAASPDGRTAAGPWPRAVVEVIANDRAPVHVNPRVSLRQATVARSSWTSFRKLFVRVTGQSAAPPVVFWVKAPIAVEADSDDREHLWFQVLAIDGDRVRGRVLRTPLTPSRLVEGGECELEALLISDWRVIVGQTVYGPEQVDLITGDLDRHDGCADDRLDHLDHLDQATALP